MLFYCDDYDAPIMIDKIFNKLSMTLLLGNIKTE